MLATSPIPNPSAIPAGAIQRRHGVSSLESGPGGGGGESGSVALVGGGMLDILELSLGPQRR
jgi:hypothetical protein